MYLHFRRSILGMIGAGVLGSLGLYQGYQVFGPGPQGANFMQTRLVEQVAERVAADLPKRPGVRTMAIVDLAGDTTGIVTAQLRSQIRSTGEFEVTDEQLVNKLWREATGHGGPVTRVDDAVAAARRIGVDSVLFGELNELLGGTQQVGINLDLQMVERDSGHAVFAHRYATRWSASPFSTDYWRARVSAASVGRRLFVWVVFALVLPVLLAPVIRRVTAIESNAVNLWSLAALTVVDGVAACAMAGFWIPTVFTGVVLTAGTAAAAYYNYRAVTMIDNLAR